MNSSQRAIPFESAATKPSSSPLLVPASPASAPPSHPGRLPALRIAPLLRDSQPRRFVRVPTHAVGVVPELRAYPRATLQLPLRLGSVDGQVEPSPITLVTRDVSSTGVFFLCPKALAPGASIGLEIVLISRPLGRGNVTMACKANVQRCEPAATPGWFGVAVNFDEMKFGRDDSVPFRFLGF